MPHRNLHAITESGRKTRGAGGIARNPVGSTANPVALSVLMRWVAGALVIALVAGCGPDEPPADLEIVANQRLTSPACGPDDGSGSRSSGTFDLAIGDSSTYVLDAIVANRTPDDVTVETARVTVDWKIDGEWVRVRVRCDLGETCEVWDLDVCAGGSCPVVPVRDRIAFDVPSLPRLVTAYFQGMLDTAVREGRNPPEFELRSNVTLLGTTAAGDAIESAEFQYEIRLCLGCLVVFPEGSDNPSLPEADCCGGPPTLTSCHPGQDDPIDCRACIVSSPDVCNFSRLSCSGS